MVKQQNLEKMAQFSKEFSKNSAKNHENVNMKLELSFKLNSFKISQKSSDFSVKISNFLQRSGGFAPRAPQYAVSTKLLSFVLGSDPRILGKKLKWQEENLAKIQKKFASVGGSAPEPPDRIKFSIILIFLSNSVQKMHAIFEKLLNFTLPISTNFLKIFPIIASPYQILFPII